MSDNGMYGDDYEDVEYDYFYVEDTYDAEDDLAEHAVPSPPPYDAEDEWDEHSRFEYWNDIEYDSDGYNDVDAPTVNNKALGAKGAGMKRKAAAGPATPSKRQKLDSKTSAPVAPLSPTPTVIWQPRGVRLQRLANLHEVWDEKKAEPYSLLGDWEARFKDVDGFKTAQQPEKEEDWEDDAEMEDITGDMDDEDDSGPSNGPISPEQGGGLQQMLAASGVGLDDLRAALQRNLAGKGGVGKLDEGALLGYLQRMMTDEGAADDVAGELADQLFDIDEDGEDEDEEEGGLSSWVAQQVEARQETGQMSPDEPEEAGEAQGSKNTSPKMASAAASPSIKTPSERQVPTPSSMDKKTTAKTSRKFKPSRGVSGVVALGQDDDDMTTPGNDTIVVAAPPDEIIDNINVAPQNDTIQVTPLRPKAPNTANNDTIKVSSPTSNPKINSNNQISDSITVSALTPVPTPGPLRNTRKRKATEEPEPVPTEPARSSKRKATAPVPTETAEKPKRKASGFNQPTASSRAKAAEAEGRKTRSAKAGGKK
ncbi:hypothetical protein K402DRAFT_391431 [Aulographum hederae CBS 113979]|uniref:Uncharacterized protein n=1 Tax=Aulographum hederae CBS 113979 TaxID=1176131 RepID=A0A6G1H6N7_9PEZI|nr:hypothetical protein K402DRAFT_391431 [Aulographum hederae CBS 113979]